MAETRARPARERERFMQIIRANLWFYRRILNVEDQSWDVIRDWEELSDSVKIRRWRGAQPQESSDAGE